MHTDDGGRRRAMADVPPSTITRRPRRTDRGRAIAQRILVRYFEGAQSLTLTLKVHRPTYTLPALTARVHECLIDTTRVHGP